MNNDLPIIGPNILPPLGEFSVVTVPVALLTYLAAHGHDDASASWHDPMSLEVTYRGFSTWTGALVVYRKTIDATMAAVRDFLGYPS